LIIPYVKFVSAVGELLWLPAIQVSSVCLPHRDRPLHGHFIHQLISLGAGWNEQ